MKKPGRTFLVTVTVVVLCSLVFAVYVASTIRSIRALRATLVELDSQRTTTAKTKEMNYQLMREDLPQKIWTMEFIESIYRTAKKLGIRDLSLGHTTDQVRTGSRRSSPAQGNRGSVIGQDAIKISFRAHYRQMAEFVREIQGFGKPMSIDSLRINRDKGELSVEMTVSAYSLGAR